ncbi:MAG: hypothetical protein MRECE_6c034 [Mycoplasmataceae bacterium CE_OT135]|nr:MAG: hypothetical protein MRECE_17c016 [Mycoplasmataceae bacterium CE_OT135]KLL03931.1 MAG: hypothetical protein MRECE_6c034 [Mycoplasmataceae bacterium CE_OT135]
MNNLEMKMETVSRKREMSQNFQSKDQIFPANSAKVRKF